MDPDARFAPLGRVDERLAGLADAHGAEQNLLLRMLTRDDYARILPQLRPVRLHLRQSLIEPNEPILDVYFVREGVASVVASEQEDGEVEVATVGNEGFVGLPLVLGGTTAPSRTFVQIEGSAWRLPSEAFRQLIEERPAVRDLLLRYANYFMDFLAQSVACNRLHSVEDRCARWLLLTHDRVQGDTFELTQDFLALMLGVRRAGVSVAMGALQAAGVVSYSRGRITIVDRPRLEEVSCRCYSVTRDSKRRLLGV